MNLLPILIPKEIYRRDRTVEMSFRNDHNIASVVLTFRNRSTHFWFIDIEDTYLDIQLSENTTNHVTNSRPVKSIHTTADARHGQLVDLVTNDMFATRNQR